jgi:DNA-binding PadR family transcriptional regulator
MPPVFAHGRLRLYLLKLLEEAPRHGYEVIRLLEERFQGLYAPSAGTVYPRLAKLEDAGLVSHTSEGGGRKVYSITDAGRAELTDRAEELAHLEDEISASLSALAADIREDVSGSARDLRREMREQARRTRTESSDEAGWQQAKEEWKRAKEELKEQARRAKREAQQAKRQAKQAQAGAATVAEVQRIARQVQDQVQGRATSGDWPGAVREGISQLLNEVGNLGAPNGSPRPTAPAWADEKPAYDDPARELEHLLDRFRDDVRDAARDHGVTTAQLHDARAELAATAARLTSLLRGGGAQDSETPQNSPVSNSNPSGSGSATVLDSAAASCRVYDSPDGSEYTTTSPVSRSISR